MTELEKFKRRMIRMVARLHVQEKKPEDELWEYLRKQTKCDCKWLWERMRALTLKRLKRLLIAEDRQENIAAIARMSLTDWLLFDCILVHEKIDVIGTELMDEGRRAEPRPMFELFSLVQRYDLEGQSGEDLARAWTAATVKYNSGGRQCSPMLLQRRWYQLKEATRQKFYDFWFIYRGNPKQLEAALKNGPTRLQAAVAKRYPHVITMPFIQWEELIEKKLVIMPPEFEIQMKARTAPLPDPIGDQDADLVLLEPEIETIDLGVDSDSDNDLREEVEGSKANQMIADEDIAAVNSITLKQEPMDDDPVVSIDLDEDQTSLDIDMESIEALKNIDIPMEDNIADDDSIDDSNSIKSTEDESRECTEAETVISEEKEKNPTTTDGIVSTATEDVTSSPTRDTTQSLDEDELIPEIPDNMPLATTGLTSEPTEDASTLNIEDVTTPIVDSFPVAAIAPKVEPTEIPEDNLPEDSELNTEMPTTTMPQIANVFGNVTLPDEAIQKLSNYLEKTKSEEITAKENINEEIEDDIIKTEIADVSYTEENVERNENDNILATDPEAVENDVGDIKPTGEKSDVNSFSEIIPDLTFEDDGIEFIDDGIIEDPVVHALEGIKQEMSNDEDKNSEESQSIDLKLLMVPVVYTKKLEHMNILKDKPVSHINDKESIEVILAESKPVSMKSIQIKEEQPVNSPVSDDEEAAHDDLFNRPESANNADTDSDDESVDGIPEEKKVNMSSILFQKPRNRDYSPLVVCKNPDFNTRLKRLTVGFLSYSRNRFLLRDCKPLTIDLCKAFESKLVDNTIYFKQGHSNEIVVKEETPDANDNDRHTPPIVRQENLIQTTVVPTSNSVQNLINNMVQQQTWSPPSKKSVEVKEPEHKDAVMERNKVIVLPNIDNVRRINQKLLIAEVSPMRVENSSCLPPVSLVSQPTEISKPPISVESTIEKPPEKQITGGTVICSGEVIAGVTNTFRKHHTGQHYRKYKTKPLPWRPIDRTYVGFWNSSNNSSSNKQNQPKYLKYPDDQLLTVDTLNKMLRVIQSKDPLNEIDPSEKAKHNKKKKSKQADELQQKVTEIQKKLTGEKSSDITAPITKPKRRRRQKRTKANESMTQAGYGTYCCWIKFKKMHRTSYNPHPCGSHCTCCCNAKSIETDPSIIKVCESIESVVEQSREIVENDIVENNATSQNNIIDVDAVEERTPEKRIIEIDAEESTTTDIVKTKTISVNTVEGSIAENNLTVNNNVEITTAEVTNIENRIPENQSRENSAVDSNSNKTILSQDHATNTDDCVVIDSDEPETQSTKLPLVKVKVVSAQDNVEIKRRRGRPPKGISHEKVKYLAVRAGEYSLMPNVQTRFPCDLRPTPARTYSQNKITGTSKRITSNRIRPIIRKKNTESDKNVLFLNSTHISKKPNNPIFLGKNKILLTDVPLLRNKNKQVANEQSPAIVNTTVPLPPGVNLMLLPHGALTCTLDPNIQLSAEEITTLGAVIEDIQKRISSVVSNTPMQTIPNTQLGPTLQLLPGAVPTAVQNISEIVNLVDEENNTEENSNTNIQENISTVADSVITIAENSKAVTENNIIVSNTIDPALDVATLANNSLDQPSLESNVETVQNTAVGNNNQEIHFDKSKETVSADINKDSTEEKDKVNTDKPETSNAVDSNNQEIISDKSKECVSADTNTDSTEEIYADEVKNYEPETSNAVGNNNQEINSDESTRTISADIIKDSREENADKVKTSEPETSNKKTILSDLMEMSGIFDEDIAPVTETEPHLQAVAPYASIPEASTVVIPPLLHVADINQPLPQGVTNSLPELTPVTSFHELKYACMQNGNFFKLDIETKILTPINVCIKKKAPETPKQFVDLTDDVDDTENEVKEKVQETDEDSLPVYIVRKTVTSSNKPPVPTLPHNESILKRSLIKKGATAKPIKLFKVVHPFANANILQKSKKDEASSENIVSDPRTETKTAKRARKQNFDNQTYEMQYVNFLESDDEQENYEFEGSFEEPAAPVDGSDSSDDEPLAKKVRRREEMHKEAQKESAVTAMETASTSDGNEPEISEENPTAVPEDVPENSELPLPMEGVEESELGPTELEFLSDHNEEEDDCILGF